ncbi:MAG TPA: TolC family protein [Terriglobales bacterium]|nr:TolC family protein [Terriglobales bacterium]
MDCSARRHLTLVLFPIILLSCVPWTLSQAIASQPAANQPASGAPITLTLQDALQRAKKVNPDYRTAQTEYGLAKEDKVQSRAALLPNVNYTTSFIYTEGHGIPGVGRFIANNGVHEYISQGTVHQDFSLENYAEFRRTQALQALAQAKLEIAARGLVVTVVQAYYGFVVAQQKYATAQRAQLEAQRFFDISQKLERGGEVAHADVIKAQIQFEQQNRELSEAELEMNRSRLELSVLVFPDFNENFAVVDDLQMPEPLPAFSEVQAAAANKNPELRAAVASVQEASRAVKAAWNGFLPSLAIDYFYGIDANRYAVNGIDPATGFPVRNLGYAATATLQLPIWNWGANRSKVKQANLREEQAHVELTATQRELLAKLRNLYAEANTARSLLDSLTRSADLAAQSLHLTTLRYQAGEASVLEVVDAQNTLTQARNSLNDGQARYRVALANLQTLTGTL